MKKKRMEFFRRALPLFLAAVIAAGTLLGTLGTVFAKAAPTKDTTSSQDYTVIMQEMKFRTQADEKATLSNDLRPGGRLYYVNFTIYVKLKNPIKVDASDDGSGIRTMDISTELDDDCDFKEGSWSPKHSGNKPLEWIDSKNESLGKQMPGYTYEFTGSVRTKSNSSSLFEFAVEVSKVGSETEKDVYIGTARDTIGNLDSLGGYEPGNYDDDDSNNTNSSSSKAEVLTTPKMIITNFEIPDEVGFGEEFRVSVEFMNNSKVKSMENVSMTVTPSEGVAILNGVNKRHYVNIPRRQSTSESFRFKAGDKLAAEAITIAIKWDYQYKVDGAYKDASSEEILSIKSIPKPEEKKDDEDKESTEGSISAFEILSIIPPEDVFPNEPAYATVKVINKDHRFDASNVQLTVTGEGLLNSGNTVYHGALAHSSQAEIEAELQFAGPGAYKLLATVIYEDSVGKDDDGKPIVRINDQQKEFTVVVQEQQMGGGMGMEGMGGMEGMDPTLGMSGFDENGMPVGGSPADTVIGWIKAHVALSVGGGVALVVIIVLVIRFIRKKKAEKDEDI